MLSKSLTTFAVALAASRMAFAQTHTDCNPMEKDCGSDKALGKELFVDFTKGESDEFYEFDGTTVEYDQNGAVFTIEKESDAPTMGSNHYIFFGKVELTVQAAPGTGIVTSFVLQSDNLDEIDWEWLGYHPNEVQTNYFGKGDDSTFDRGGFHEVNGVQSTQHTYTIDWTKDYVRWYVNGNQIRELKYAEAKGGSRFPQTPMQIRLGTWVAGRSDAPEGTVQWSGGLADFSNGPSKAYYKSIKITDYSNGVKGATEYEWAPAPNDGSYESIKVITGDGSEGSDNSTSTTSAPSSSATKTDKETKTDEPKSTSTGSDSGSSNSTVTTSTGVRPTNNPVPGGNDTSSGPSSGSGSGSSPSPSASAPPQSGATFMAACSTALLGAGLLVSFFAL